MNALQRLFVWPVCVAVSTLCASNAPAVEPAHGPTTIKAVADKGPVTGWSSPTINTFLGIPYAAPPVGLGSAPVADDTGVLCPIWLRGRASLRVLGAGT